MSRAEAARDRILVGARALGAREGVGALSLQAIAAEARVSKALVLYHFAGKSALLDAIMTAVGEASAARLTAATRTPHAMPAWRALLGSATARGEAALLNALGLEAATTPAAARTAQAMREGAATALALAVLKDIGLAPRVPAVAIGRLLLRQLDGLAAASPREEMAREALEAELDTFALALIGLAR